MPADGCGQRAEAEGERAMAMRKEKLTTLEEALGGLEPGATVAIGGWIFENTPMGAIRQLVRQGARDLSLVPAPGSIGPDLLIAAGCVREVYVVFISFEDLGLAPAFRRAVEAGQIRVRECDGPGLAAGLRAAATSLPYEMIHATGSDLHKVNPEFYRPGPDRPDGGKTFLVPPLEADLTLIHAQAADPYGNVAFYGTSFFDLLLARAARRLVVTVDHVVPPAVLQREIHTVRLPGFLVDAVVHVPFGAHPCASQGLYARDTEHLQRYVRDAATVAGAAQYLKQFVHGAPTQIAYLEEVGLSRLRGLTSQRLG